jgi:hypothetical protein
MRTTIRLDDQLLRKAKARAAERGIPLNDFITDAIRAALQRRDSRGAAVQLPTFRGGTLLPGIDLDDSSAMLDLMEAARGYPPVADLPPARVAGKTATTIPKSRARRRK